MVLINKIAIATIIFCIIPPAYLSAQTTDIESINKSISSGQFNRAKTLIDSLPHSASKLAIQGRYYLATKNLSEAISSFEESLKLEPLSINSTIDLAYCLWLQYLENQELKNRLAGVVYIDELETIDTNGKTKAIDLWQKALIMKPSISEAARVSIYLYRATKDPAYLSLAQKYAALLPNNRAKVTYLINIYNISSDKKWLKLALKLPSDRRSKSWIYYQLGEFETAIAIAESVPAPDLSWRYLWAYAQNSSSQTEKDNYLAQAVTTVEFLRSRVSLPASDLNLLYKEYAASLFDRHRIGEGLKAIDLLNIDRLERFFEDNCFDSLVLRTALPSNTARLTTLVQDKQTYIVIERGERQNLVKITISKAQISEKVALLRLKLQDVATNQYLVPARELYEDLIVPILPFLEGADSLVVNNDSLLSTIPLSALYSGKKFLVEDFAISYSAGSTKTSAPSSPSADKALVVAIANPPKPWQPLPYASAEASSVSNQVKSVQVRQDLTFGEFQTALNRENFNVLHLATHSRIAVDLEQSRIVFRDKYATIADLVAIFPNSLSLLVLSGCQTAIGDSNSVLGLAGLAIKNNVEQVLASLWAINDADTAPLMARFYQYRQEKQSTSQALRLAQIDLIKTRRVHPSVWSSFILVKQ